MFLPQANLEFSILFLNSSELLLLEDSQYADVVRVYNVWEKKLILLFDIVAQRMFCFFE
jgi:hypothetical protein